MAIVSRTSPALPRRRRRGATLAPRRRYNPKKRPKHPSKPAETPPKAEELLHEDDAAAQRRVKSEGERGAVTEAVAAAATPPRTAPQPPVTPKAKLTLDSLEATEHEEDTNLPKTLDEIPDYLFSPKSKSYKVAALIIFENIKDAATLAKRAEVTRKTARNIWNKVRRLAEPILRPRTSTATPRRSSGDGGDAAPSGDATGNSLQHRCETAASSPASPSPPSPASRSQSSPQESSAPPKASEIVMHPDVLFDG